MRGAAHIQITASAFLQLPEDALYDRGMCHQDCMERVRIPLEEATSNLRAQWRSQCRRPG